MSLLCRPPFTKFCSQRLKKQSNLNSGFQFPRLDFKAFADQEERLVKASLRPLEASLGQLRPVEASGGQLRTIEASGSQWRPVEAN